MRRAKQIQLTEDQRHELNKLVKSGTAQARVLTRARIVLLASKGESNLHIANSLDTSERTVIRIRQRFQQEGMQALYERQRPGRVPIITGDIEAKLVTLACSSPPQGRARWTLQLLADKMVELGYLESISDVGVMKRLKKIGLDLGRSRVGAYPSPTNPTPRPSS
jgi:putative transposase